MPLFAAVSGVSCLEKAASALDKASGFRGELRGAISPGDDLGREGCRMAAGSDEFALLGFEVR